MLFIGKQQRYCMGTGASVNYYYELLNFNFIYFLCSRSDLATGGSRGGGEIRPWPPSWF